MPRTMIPMALEMGLGVTPWGPLHRGAPSGKYTRENRLTVKADRGATVNGQHSNRWPLAPHSDAEPH